MRKASYLGLALAALLVASCQPNQNKTKDGNQANDGIEALTDKDSSSDNEELQIPDMNIKDIDGKDHSLRQEIAKSKITIIDFWASWCGPCRNEMPHLVSLYDNYKSKGLGIVGISLDNDRESWREAISELGITWCQLSDLGGWESEPAQIFNVRAIPFTIITDSKGVVLAAGLRGGDLDTFIEGKLNANSN